MTLLLGFSESAVKKLLINFLNFALDIGSLKDTGRLFHNIAPLNFNDR